MNAKKTRLGRGLDALLSGPEDSAAEGVASAEDQLTTLPIEKLQRGEYQPRTHMDQESLDELAESIKSQGIIQPILVRAVDDGQYEIIAGERRWRAAQIAQLQDVPVIIRDIPDEATLAVALIENIQRENLNPVEEAMGLKRLLDEFELTHQQVADSVGRSRSAVSNLLRLLSLAESVKDRVFAGDLEMGHARALLVLTEDQQIKAAETVAQQQLSVRQTEALIKRLQSDKSSDKPKPRQDPDIRNLENQLSDTLKTTVSIKDSGGKGKLIIEYRSLDALDGILTHIK